MIRLAAGTTSSHFSPKLSVRKIRHPVRTLTKIMEQSTANLAGVTVTISTPRYEPSGITFLLPGAMIAISEYDSIRNALIHNNRIVLSFFTNVLTTQHRVMAMWVKDIFDDFRQQYRIQQFDKYSIVGHSVGAKVALMVAAHTDKHRVSAVLSLDPIDMNPAEFTSGNIKLANATAPLYITWASAGGMGITNSNNPRAVYQADPAAVARFVEFKDAGHMAYADNGGGLPGMLMRSGTKEGNNRAHTDTLELVRSLIR